MTQTKDEKFVTKDEKFVIILSKLNYKHNVLFEKLSEAEVRLNLLTQKLGGEFPTEEKPMLLTEGNHLGDYFVLLNNTEHKLESIFYILNRLEYLCD